MKQKLTAFWAWLKPLLVDLKNKALANKTSFFIGLAAGFVVGLLF